MLNKRIITIIGSTGSIGMQTLDIIRIYPDKFKIFALIANNQIDKLIAQAKEFLPNYIVIANKLHYKQAQRELSNYQIEILAGEDEINNISSQNVDVVVAACIGFCGLMPIINGLKSGNIIAIANKEVLICAGHIIGKFITRENQIIPIDSEHNAIFQIINDRRSEISNLTITASGGAFFQSSKEKTLENALRHPIWSMGKKITIDSSTLVNKVLEVIEAHYLFNIPINKINILIHPQSIIHGMISYIDGTSISTMYRPDMRIPISYAINYPQRLQLQNFALDLAKIDNLSFFAASEDEFPAIKLLKYKNFIAINAANEIVVQYFLEKKITFNEIIKIIDSIVEENETKEYPQTIEGIILLDKKIRQQTIKLIEKKH